MKYYCGEPELVLRLREIFPDTKVSRNPKEGTVSVCYGKTWRTWDYQVMSPEQQLDTLTRYIERHFGIKGIKSRNGKIHPI